MMEKQGPGQHNIICPLIQEEQGEKPKIPRRVAREAEKAPCAQWEDLDEI